MTHLVLAGRPQAVQYLRMSTEHQRYSLENQRIAIAEYAKQHGYDVIGTYADPGKSGLTLRERKELSRLLRDVTDPERRFSAILVLDISRWGRFQDPDQHAAYEFLCREMGVHVEYVAEPFANDGSASSSILKHLKRVMAGEYSRELSAKISRAQQSGASKGFLQGGPVIYGFRRLLVDANGKPLRILQAGERKHLMTDKVLLVHGPPEEIRIIKRIFRLFTEGLQSMRCIARTLNAEGVSPGDDLEWSAAKIRRILSSELMIGVYAYNQTGRKLKTPLVKNPEALWVRSNVVKPLVSRKAYDVAQQLLDHRTHTYSKAKMLAGVRRLLAEKGSLSAILINACPYVPSTTTLRHHFGTLRQVYAEVGYDDRSAWHGRLNAEKQALPNRDAYTPHEQQMLVDLENLLAEKGDLNAHIIRDCSYTCGPGLYRRHFGSLLVAYKLVGFLTDRQWQRRCRTGLTKAEGLEGLRRLYAQNGHLSVEMIAAAPDLPCIRWYYRYFGSILEAYRQAGLPCSRGENISMARRKALSQFLHGSDKHNAPKRSRFTSITDNELFDGIRRLHAQHGYISTKLIDADPDLPSFRWIYSRFASVLHAYEMAGFKYDRLELSKMARHPRHRKTGTAI